MLSLRKIIAAASRPLSRTFRTHPYVFSILLDSRRVFINGMIDEESSNSVICQLMYLEHKEPTLPIQIIINSRGGSFASGMAIYDQIQSLACPVHTSCVGNAASMAAVLLAAGKKGFRYASINSFIMIHSASAGFQGFTRDVKIGVDRLLQVEEDKIVVRKLAKHTGLSIDFLMKSIKRDNYISPQQAKELGFIDVIGNFPSLTRKSDSPSLDDIDSPYPADDIDG
ncbi:ATP-dependent Clp protease proteolytic subunit-like [Impatiens glandulifera]|uniref:ATP-dependent Clp protease proteolytic subunit-like n=1 Tax=Impatiens glandulifera TaxID=253017 RepID=UPI001FB1222E|nr:ATP-dependent Clp protease proteolytic subunit-like [Impatiens glandulifera]